MPRDYKNRPTAQRPKARKAVPVWLSASCGFALGLCVAIGAFVEGRYPGTVVSWGHDAVPQPAADAELEADVAEEAEPKRRPRFTFYSLLPEMEVSVANTERLERRAPPAPKPVDDGARAARILAGGEVGAAVDLAHAAAAGYLLQVGSFKDPLDADRLKAELALNGLKAFIQTAMMSDRSKRHRVRLGPYRKVEDARRISARLADNGVRPLLVRVDS